MKKHLLILLAISPVIIGYLYNFSFMVPVLGTLLFYLAPIAMLIYWFWAGKKFARSGMRPFSAIFFAHLSGFICLALYFWQFSYVADAQRNLFFAGLSQTFSSPVLLFVVRIAMLFEPQKNSITQITAATSQVLGLTLMVIIFAIGYIMGKKTLQDEESL